MLESSRLTSSVPFCTEQSRRQLVWASLVALYAMAAICVYGDSNLIGDETIHFYLIDHFRGGDFNTGAFIRDYLTMLPGFHLTVAGLMASIGVQTIGWARLFNLLFALAAIGIFHKLRQRSSDDEGGLATAQFMVLPILMPFFFLAYTDTLSLACVLAASLATCAGRHWLSAIALLAALAVRQNNIVWAGFLAALAGWPLLLCGLSQWRALLHRTLPYLFALGIFLVYWRLNGSISLSQGQAPLHPDLSLHCGNIFFALFLLGLLMPVQLAQGAHRFVQLAIANPFWLLLPLGLLGLFWWGFRVDHPYNLIPGNFSLRNNVLKAIRDDGGLRAAMGLIATAAGCGLAGIRLRPAASRWLFPFAVFFLAASWLIETRYTLIPIVLWLAFRERSSAAIEGLTLVYWFVATAFLFFSVIDNQPFL